MLVVIYFCRRYKTSGGLHGVGASVVNALCEWVEVTVHTNGKIYQMKFSDGGKNISELKVLGKTTKLEVKYAFYRINEFSQLPNSLFHRLQNVLRKMHSF